MNYDANLVRIVFNHEQYRRIDTTGAAVQRLETEAMVLGAVEQTPRTALGTGR